MKGYHSAGLPGLGRYWEDCQLNEYVDNFQMYSRYWPVPGVSKRKRFALLFATYHPKIIQDSVSYKENARNHRNFWQHYAVFVEHVVNDVQPYACAFYAADGRVTGLPWNKCLITDLENERPIVLIDLANIKVGTSRYVSGNGSEATFNLAAWEFLHIEEIQNFNSVDWDRATCLMQNLHFESAMAAFHAATEDFY